MQLLLERGRQKYNIFGGSAWLTFDVGIRKLGGNSLDYILNSQGFKDMICLYKTEILHEDKHYV